MTPETIEDRVRQTLRSVAGQTNTGDPNLPVAELARERPDAEPARHSPALRAAAIDLRAGGVGYYPESQFVHVDTGRVRLW